MAKWLILVGTGVVVVVLIFLLLAYLRRGTLYISNASGFRSISGSVPPQHRTDKVGLRKVIDRFLKGDIYDLLGISNKEDRYGGLALNLDVGVPKLTVFFYTNREKVRIDEFRKAMSGFSFPLLEESNGFNGGMTEADRQTTLEYTLPADPEKILLFVDAALRVLEGPGTSDYYLTASLLSNGPGIGSGIKLRAPEDPLRQVLND